VSADDGASVTTRRRAVVLVAALGTLAYAALASTTRVNTVPAVVAVALPGAAVAVLTLRRPERPGEASQLLRRTTTLWAVVALTGLLWEAGAYFGELTIAQYDHPTLSILLEPSLQSPTVRFAAWVLWLWAGWRLVRR
jgi:hypothetical protein